MIFGLIKNERKNSFSLTLNFLFLAILIALISMFSVQTMATAGESSEDGDSSSKSVPTVEEMLRLRDTLTSQSATSLSMTCERGLVSSLRMTEENDLASTLNMTDGDNAITQADSDKQLSKDGSRVAMFRLYNKYTGEHFYTSSISERDTISKVGWKYEKIEWYAPTSTKKSPVYRLYNPYVEGGDHHYTTNATERDNCIKEGWRYEGVGWYTVDKGEVDRVSVLRQYNPFAITGTHNYTTNKAENDNLVKLGWKAEGEGWGGYSKLEPTGGSSGGDSDDGGSEDGTTKKALDFTKISVTTTAKTFNGKAQTQTVRSSAYKLNTDYTVTYSNNKNAGTASIVVKGKGNYTGLKTYKFTINKLNISKATVTLNGTGQFTYDKTEHEQKVSKVVANGITLSTAEYTVSNNKQTDAGTYNLMVTGKGNFTGTATKAFSIAKAKPVCVAPTGLTGYVGGTLSSVDIASETVTGNTPGKFEWEEGTQTLGDVAEYSFSATFTPTETKNYETVKNISVRVSTTRGFWLGTKNASEKFIDEVYFAQNDSNYVSSKDISADMEVLHDSSSSNYTTVKKKWDKYYSDDNVRLYATYEGGEKEAAYDGTSTSAKNKFVEFRILEVSGADGHKLSDGETSDGSAVTFMATHVLPTAYQMNTEAKNDGGWGACQLYKDMNKVGETKGKIYSKFSDNLVSQVEEVTKEYNTGNKVAQSDTPSTVKCQFWIPSYTELVSSTASDYASWLPKLEGTQYTWCANNVTEANADNPCIAYTTRGSTTPGSCHFASCRWWGRSPNVKSTDKFGLISNKGEPNFNDNANLYFGVVPAFCF